MKQTSCHSDEFTNLIESVFQSRYLFQVSNQVLTVESLNLLLVNVLETESKGNLQWRGAAPEKWTLSSSIYFSVKGWPHRPPVNY